VDTQAQFDIAKALAAGQLRKGHAQELIETGKALDVVMSLVAPDCGPKSIERQVIHELGKDESTLMHGAAPRGGTARIARIELKSMGG
jgi:hypothetical protein